MSKFSSLFSGVAVLLMVLFFGNPVKAQEKDSPEVSWSDVTRDQGGQSERLLGSSGLVLREVSVTTGISLDYYHVLKRGKETWAQSPGAYGFLEGQVHLGTWNYTRFEVGGKLFGQVRRFQSHGGPGDPRYNSRSSSEGGQLYVIVRDTLETDTQLSYGYVKAGVSLAHTWDQGQSGGSGTYYQRYDALQIGGQVELSINFPFRMLISPDSQVTIARNNWKQTVFKGWFPFLRLSGEYVHDTSVHGRQSVLDQNNNRIGQDGRNRNSRYLAITDLGLYRFTNDTENVKDESLHVLDLFVRGQWTAASALGYNSIHTHPSKPHFVNSFGVGGGVSWTITLEAVQIGLHGSVVYTYEDRGINAAGPDRGAVVLTGGIWINFGS